MQAVSVIPVAPAILRVKFSKMPFTARANVPYDALFPLNYHLLGPNQTEVLKVRTVSGDPFSVDLVLTNKLNTGSWLVTVSAGIETPDGSVTTEQKFTLAINQNTKYLSNNGVEVTGEDVVRSHLNPKFAGGAWGAFITALGYSDELLAKSAKFAYFQNFLSTAKGLFLERLTNAISVDRPPNTGLSDEALSQLAIAISANRVVTHPYLEVLKAYYGASSTSANFSTELTEPFSLSDGQYLNWMINGTELTTAFDQNAFTDITQATAFEVAQALNRAFALARVSAVAAESVDPVTGNKTVQVFSKWLGTYGSLLITGGTAQKSLRFPKIIDTVSVAGVQWQIMTPTSHPGVVPYGKAWLRWLGGTDPEIYDVYQDDYVSIYDTAFNTVNQGDFQILSVGVYLGKKYVEITNSQALAQGSVVQAGTDTVLFFDDSTTTLPKSSNYFATATQPWPGQVDVLLPATAGSITRSLNTGWYVNGKSPLGISNYNAFRAADGYTTVSTDTDHGMAVGDFVQMQNMSPLVERDTYFATMTNTGTSNTYSFALQPHAELDDGRFFVRKPDSWVIYDPETNTWAETFDAGLMDRTGGAAITLDSGRVLIVGGTGGASTAEVYDPDANVIVPVGNPTNTYPSLHAQMVKLDNGDVVLAGGTGLGVAEIFSPATNLWTALTASVGLGPFPASQIVVDDSNRVWGWYQTTVFMLNFAQDPVFSANGYSTYVAASSRRSGELIYIPQATGQIWYVGGYDGGGAVQNTAAVFELGIRDQRAYPIDPLADTVQLSYTRGYGQLTRLRNGTYLLFGGTTGPMAGMPAGTMTGPPPEIINFTATRQSLFTRDLSSELTLNYEPLCPIYTKPDGKVLVVSPLQPVYHQLNLFQQISSGRSDGFVKVLAVPAPDSFEYQSEKEWVTTWQTGTATPVAAEDGDIQSGYIINPESGVTVGDTNPTLTADLFPGPAPATIAVSSVAGIANSPGYVIFDFGQDTQSPPIRYLGTAGNALRLDQSATIQRGYPIGTVASVLISTSPYVPSGILDVGLTFATASSAGRLAASSDIDDIKAIGVTVNKTVLYPADTGLGNAGQPTEGAQKLSDVVWVYGGDNLAELDAAREGDGGI